MIVARKVDPIPRKDPFMRAALLAAFREGVDTYTLAKRLNISEWHIYNAIAQAREEQRDRA